MKRIEDIERMTLEQLEAIAEDTAVKAPEGLHQRIEDAVLAQAMSARTKRRLSYGIGSIAVAAAAGLALIFTTPQQPKDTFDDPALAYAQLEATFAYISSKMDKGLEIAAEAEPIFDKTTEAINGKK